MRKSKAKERILEVAEEAIRDKGYSNFNVNDVAYGAEVSIGTLYYHFPEGKTSILSSLLTKMQKDALDSSQPLLEKLKMLPGESLDENLGNLFMLVLKQRRKNRHFLAAVQTEMLTDLEQYQKVLESYESNETMQQGWGMFVDIIGKISERFPEESIDIKGHETKIARTIGTLMTYQIMIPNYLGSDAEFVKMLLGILRVIVTN